MPQNLFECGEGCFERFLLVVEGTVAMEEWGTQVRCYSQCLDNHRGWSISKELEVYPIIPFSERVVEKYPMDVGSSLP